jgi:hypothetical protein
MGYIIILRQGYSYLLSYRSVVFWECGELDSGINVYHYLQSIKENTHDEIFQILVGNKCDMSAERTVDTSEGKQLANQYNIPFLEVSAKEN